KEAPFFLYVAHSMPHVPIYASPDFLGTSDRGLYGDVVQELDWSVGQVVASLEAAGVMDNTLILFTSDNGPWLAMGNHGGSAGGLRDGKGTSFDGGMRVPTVAYAGGGVAGAKITAPVSTLDLLPTIARLTGSPLPADRALDGHDVSALFRGDGADAIPYFYFEAWNRRVDGVRLGDWKLKRASNFFVPDIIMSWALRLGEFSHGELLFNLAEDPGETDNLIDDHPEKAEELRALLAEGDKIVPETRERMMLGSGADRAGYGRLISMAGVVALVIIGLAGGLIYFALRTIRRRLFAR
ncbi:MAG: sulfatase-like hydrolase/transferase, partial [Parvibaculum sp.]